MPRTLQNFATLATVSSATFFAALTDAMAQTAPAGAPAGAPVSPLMNLVPFIVMLGIMYMLMIRPQMKKQKLHQEFLVNLKRGDEVLTSGGILGRIEGMTDLYVTLEIAPGVRIKVLRAQVASSASMAAQSTSDTKEAKSEGKA